MFSCIVNEGTCWLLPVPSLSCEYKIFGVNALLFCQDKMTVAYWTRGRCKKYCPSVVALLLYFALRITFCYGPSYENKNKINQNHTEMSKFYANETAGWQK